MSLLPSPLPGPIDPSDAAAELLRRRAARSRLLEFVLYTYLGYAASWHHVRLCRALDRFAAGECKRLIVNMPPRHGKSELASRRFPALLLGQDPDLSLIACSHTASLASAMNRDVQRILEMPQYKRLFPGTRLSEGNVRTVAGAPLRNSDLFEIVGRKGAYRCAGVGGSIVGQGFDVGIIDDPVKSREEADSPTVRENTWAWYTGDFYTRRAPNARILVIMTRWHEDDLVGRLLKTARDDPRADQWEVLTLPAVCEQEAEGDPRQPGEALWPERYPLEELDKTRAANPYDWDSQYQQHPRAQGSVEWPDSLFPPSLWFDDWPSCIRRRVLALDPSKGRSDKSGDYSAFVSLGLDDDWTLWVDCDMARRPVETRDSGPSIVGDGLAIARTWKPEAFSIETNGFQELVAEAFLRVAEEQTIHLPLYGVNSTDPKPIRIRQIGTYLAQRRLRVRNTPGGRLLVQQLREFPTGMHDDGPDALAQAVVLMNHLLGNRAESNQPRLMRA